MKFDLDGLDDCGGDDRLGDGDGDAAGADLGRRHGAYHDLGTVTVTGTDTVNPATVTDTVAVDVVDDGPKANPDTATAADGGAGGDGA